MRLFVLAAAAAAAAAQQRSLTATLFDTPDCSGAQSEAFNLEDGACTTAPDGSNSFQAYCDTATGTGGGHILLFQGNGGCSGASQRFDFAQDACAPGSMIPGLTADKSARLHCNAAAAVSPSGAPAADTSSPSPSAPVRSGVPAVAAGALPVVFTLAAMAAVAGAARAAHNG